MGLIRSLRIFISFIIVVQFIREIQACDNGQCKISESCKQTADCMSGLVCSNMCSNGSRCLRSQSFNVLKLNQSLPFNKYSWLTTHNSFAIENSSSLTGAPIVTFENQEDSVSDQLKNGVRGLMLDMYDFQNDIWLCHSFGGQCQNFTAFQPAINTLKEIESFLSANPREIITIFIEDYVRSTNGLSNLFRNAGLMKYWFPVSKMPKDGSDWPLVTDMISDNQRLIVFTSISSKEASEGIAYEWNYVLETQYGDASLRQGQCISRGESSALNNNQRSLILQNYFPTNPDTAQACRDNSNPLSQMINTCYTAAGNRWANFIAVDFYKRSTGGGSFHAVDILNGRLMCGCGDVHECQSNLAPGVCNTTNTPQVAETADTPNTSSNTPVQPSPSSSVQLRPLYVVAWIIFSLCSMIMH